MDAPFFKLLAGTEPATDSLGVMTQAIGFPLRDVEDANAGIAVNVTVESALDANSFIDQLPSGLGVALQITFGDAQTTDTFDVDAAGNITCLVTDEYALRGKFVVGRRGGAAAEAQLYTRLLINGTPSPISSHTIVDNPNIEIPYDFEANGTLLAGDVLTFEIIRDTDGNDSGGLYAGIPAVAGWASSPSARLIISRFLATASA